MKINNDFLDYAEMLAEKDEVDKKVKKLELNKKLRDERKKHLRQNSINKSIII